jgi:signal transduction histidine kinase
MEQMRLYKRSLLAAFVLFAVWEGIKHLVLMEVPMWVQHSAPAFIEMGLALAIVVAALRALGAHQRELDRVRGMRDRLASALANDLRQPLLEVVESLGELGGSPEIPAGTQRVVRRAVESTRPLVGMAVELLRVTPPQETSRALEPLDCSHMLRTACQTAQVYAAAKRVEIQADISGSAGLVRALPHSLFSAMLLLLENAVSVTERGEQVSVVGHIGASRNVEIAITDSGSPMKQDEVEALEGEGVQEGAMTWDGAHLERPGLHYCAAVIRSLDGLITVTRAETPGNTVTISLPLALDEAA